MTSTYIPTTTFHEDMSVIDPIDDPEKQSAIESVLETAEQNGTPGQTFLQVLGHRPKIAETWTQTWNTALYEGEVNHCLKELVRIRLAQLHDCLYCQGVGSNPAKELGLPDAKVRSLDNYETDDRFSKRERVALRFAEDFYHDRHDFNSLRETFSDPEVVELAWLVALQDGSKKIVSKLNLESERCELPADEQAATLPGNDK